MLAAPRLLMVNAVAPSSPRRAALLSVLVQAAGAAATLLVSVCITRLFGVEAQGQFGLLKGWLDTLVTALLFGLPQTLLHASYQDSHLAPALRRFAQRYSLGWLAVALAGVVAAPLTPWPWLVWPLLAAPPLVYHGLLRSLLLRESGALVYAVVTVAPACALLALVVALALTGTKSWGVALAGSAWAALAFTYTVSRHRAGTGAAEKALPPALWRINGHAFVQNLAAAAQPALLLSLMHGLGATARQVGEVALAMLFMQVFAALAAFSAPALYDRVASGAGLGQLRRHWQRAVALVVFMLVFLLTLAPWLLAWALPAGEWPASSLVQVARWMLLAGGLTLASRLAATVLQAHGRFAELSAQALLRLVLSLGGLVLLQAFGLAIGLAAAVAWALSEALILARCGWLLGWPARQVQA